MEQFAWVGPVGRQCELALEDSQGKFLLQRLADRFQGLKRLDLENNKIGDAAVQVLADRLSGWLVEYLNLKKNCVKEAGAKCLANVISQPRPASLILNLEQNELQKEGEDALREALITALRRNDKPNFRPYSLLKEARAAVAS